MESLLQDLLKALALPEYGLSTLFVFSFLAATLVPLAATPFLAGLIKLNPELFWPAILVATVGNTLGGSTNWWIGYGAKNIQEKISKHKGYGKAMLWLQRFGPKACVFGWMPIVGEVLCIASGWLRLSFWPCMVYMFLGRFARFLFVAMAIRLLWPGAYSL